MRLKRAQVRKVHSFDHSYNINQLPGLLGKLLHTPSGLGKHPVEGGVLVLAHLQVALVSPPTFSVC